MYKFLNPAYGTGIMVSEGQNNFGEHYTQTWLHLFG